MPSLPSVAAFSPVDLKTFGPRAPPSSHFYLVHPRCCEAHHVRSQVSHRSKLQTNSIRKRARQNYCVGVRVGGWRLGAGGWGNRPSPNSVRSPESPWLGARGGEESCEFKIPNSERCVPRLEVRSRGGTGGCEGNCEFKLPNPELFVSSPVSRIPCPVSLVPSPVSLILNSEVGPRFYPPE
jgi:hypothetical protein